MQRAVYVHARVCSAAPKGESNLQEVHAGHTVVSNEVATIPSVVAPKVGLYVPALQGVGAAEPEGQKEPVGQVMQLEAEVPFVRSRYVPAAQGNWVEEFVPAGQ